MLLITNLALAKALTAKKYNNTNTKSHSTKKF